MSSTSARENILGRLRKANSNAPLLPQPEKFWKAPSLTPKERLAAMQTKLEAVKADCRVVTEAALADELKKIIADYSIATLAHGENTWFDKELKKVAKDTKLVAYSKPAEEFRDKLFEMDGGITSTMGAVAEQGSILLWPSVDEPRQLSLVPRVHIALVRTEQIYSTLAETITKMNWTKNIPTNSVMIAGPSRTSDIEMTLAIGVHGPGHLVVLLIDK